MAKSPKVDQTGVILAQLAQARAAEAANNLSQNFKKDLSTENLTTAVAGGSADTADTVDLSGTRKKRTAAGLSSSLGVNV